MVQLPIIEFGISYYNTLFSVASNFVRLERFRLRMSVPHACLELHFFFEGFRQSKLATSENEENNLGGERGRQK